MAYLVTISDHDSGGGWMVPNRTARWFTDLIHVKFEESDPDLCLRLKMAEIYHGVDFPTLYEKCPDLAKKFLHAMWSTAVEVSQQQHCFTECPEDEEPKVRENLAKSFAELANLLEQSELFDPNAGSSG